MPGEIVLLVQFLAAVLLLAQLLGIVLGDEGAGLLAEGGVFGRKVEVHGAAPWCEHLQRISLARTIGERAPHVKMTFTFASLQLIAVQVT